MIPPTYSGYWPCKSSQDTQVKWKVVDRSTYQGVTNDEHIDPVITKTKDAFDKEVALKLGSGLRDSNCPESETHTFDMYEDDNEGTTPQISDADESLTMPDTIDQYIGPEVTLPKGTKWSQVR